MRVFLSWSGERSRAVAAALREWLPLVVHFAEPWMSDRDIVAGERWSVEIGNQLAESHFGVICLTRENLVAPWLLFEAGALSKQLTTGTVVPYLLDVDFGDVSGPLSQFQSKKAEPAATLDLVFSINARGEHPIPENRIRSLFELVWPKLDTLLTQIPAAGANTHAPRQTAEVLEDLVATVRSFDHRLAAFEKRGSGNPALAELVLRPIAREEVQKGTPLEPEDEEH